MRIKATALKSAAVMACTLGLAVGTAGGPAFAATYILPVQDGFGKQFGYGEWNDDPSAQYPAMQSERAIQKRTACRSRSGSIPTTMDSQMTVT